MGVYAVRRAPHETFATFIQLAGLTLITRGILDIAAVFVDRISTRRIMLVIAGIAAIVAGIVLLLQPVAAGVAFVWLLGLYSLVFGSLMMVTAMELRNELPS